MSRAPAVPAASTAAAAAASTNDSIFNARTDRERASERAAAALSLSPPASLSRSLSPFPPSPLHIPLHCLSHSPDLKLVILFPVLFIITLLRILPVIVPL